MDSVSTQEDQEDPPSTAATCASRDSKASEVKGACTNPQCAALRPATREGDGKCTCPQQQTAESSKPGTAGGAGADGKAAGKKAGDDAGGAKAGDPKCEFSCNTCLTFSPPRSHFCDCLGHRQSRRSATRPCDSIVVVTVL